MFSLFNFCLCSKVELILLFYKYFVILCDIIFVFCDEMKVSADKMRAVRLPISSPLLCFLGIYLLIICDCTGLETSFSAI